MKNISKESLPSLSIDSILFPIIIGTILFGLLILFTIYFVVKYSEAQKKLLLKQLEFNDKLLKIENEIRNDTNEILRRELHDNFGSILSIIRMQLKAYVSNIKDDGTSLVSKSIDLTDDLIKDVKNLSATLKQSDFFEINLFKSLEKLIESINDSNVIKISYQFPEFKTELPSNISIHLFRIFQELFNNSIQHSKAASISVIVKVENDELVFEYIDDGIGFDKNDLNFKEGSGLNSIRERADIIHVKMQVESIKNVMTKTVLCLDLKSIENGKN